MEHNIVERYSGMIAEEFTRYKKDMLEYFHAREFNPNATDVLTDESQFSNINRQLYTTSLAGTTYELEGYSSSGSDTTQKGNIGMDDDDEEESTARGESDDRIGLQSDSYDLDQAHNQTFLTEDTTSGFDSNEVPFYKAFQIPSNLIPSVMFK